MLTRLKMYHLSGDPHSIDTQMWLRINSQALYEVWVSVNEKVGCPVHNRVLRLRSLLRNALNRSN